MLRHQVRAPVLAALLAVAVAACTSGRPAAGPTPTTPPAAPTPPRPQLPARLAGLLGGTVVLYGIGVSTDPHADGTSARGVGVATATGGGQLARAEVRGSGWGGDARWLRSGQVLVERPARAGPPAGWLVYRYAHGRLGLAGRFPLPSPVGKWDSSPDGSLLALDPETGTRTPLLSGAWVAALAGRRSASLLPPVYSADGRYLAARASIVGGPGEAIVLARADGPAPAGVRAGSALRLGDLVAQWALAAGRQPAVRCLDGARRRHRRAPGAAPARWAAAVVLPTEPPGRLSLAHPTSPKGLVGTRVMRPCSWRRAAEWCVAASGDRR